LCLYEYIFYDKDDDDDSGGEFNEFSELFKR
jgi:hypothetical protein